MKERKHLEFSHYKLVRRNVFVFIHSVLCIILMVPTQKKDMIEFNFLPILTQGLHLAVFDRRSLCMNGRHVCTAISVIPPSPGMCGVVGFDICIFDGVGDGGSTDHTNTANLYIKIIPVVVNVWAYLETMVLIFSVGAVPHLFEDGIFWRQTSH